MVMPKSTAKHNFMANTSLGKLSKSEESVFSEREDKPVMGKRVRFSQPLEHWKEFDQNTGILQEWNQKPHLQKSKDPSVRSKAIDTSNKYENIKKSRGKVVRTITEAVQAFRIEDEKTSVRKFIAHYKRTTVHVPDRTTHKKVQNAIVSEFEKPSTTASLGNNLGSNFGHCKLCNSTVVAGDEMLNIPSNGGKSNTLRPSIQRPFLLPSLQSDRKVFEERLLPQSAHNINCDYINYLRSDYQRKGIPLNQPTPFIVQLFE